MSNYQPRHTLDPVWFNGVQVNDLTFQTNGYGVIIDGISGWDDLVAVRDTRDQNPGQDGETALASYLSGRTMTMTGTVSATSWANLQTRKRTLAATLQPTSTECLFKLPDPATASPTAVYASSGMTGYERVYAKVIEGLQFGEMIGSCAQRWSVSLRASDPRIYSDTVTTTSSTAVGTASRTATFTNTGTYPSPQTIVVTGPAGPAWTLTEPTGGLVIGATAQTLGASEYVTLDIGARTATIFSTYSGSRTKQSYNLGMWMLGDTSGTVAVDDKLIQNGAYNGGFTLNQTGPLSGVASVALNGTTGYVSVASAASQYPAATGYAICEGWVKVNNTTGTQVIMDGVTSNQGFGIELVSGQWTLRAGNGSSTQTTSTGQYASASTWYHFEFSILKKVGTLRVNGVLVYSTNSIVSTGYSAATSGGYRFGVRLAGTNFLNGNLAAISIDNGSPTNGWYTLSSASTTTSSCYSSLAASVSQWKLSPVGAQTYTLASSTLNAGSKLDVSYRSARL